MSTVGKLLRFCWTSWKLNLAGAMEFRMSFLLTAGMMMVNNTVWIFFWGVYFRRFPIVGGWTLTDVMMMWSVVTAGFGLSYMLFGNSLRIAGIVANGQLDPYLAQPKPILLHMLVSRMSITAMGDAAFGLILYVVYGDHSAAGLLRYALAVLLSGILFVFFHVLTQSLAFFIGNAEGLGHQFFNTFLTFTTYPTGIFKGWGRVLLFTLLPAGFISYMPIGLLRQPDPVFIAGAIGAALAMAAAGTGLFYRGVRRYSSGNSMGLRA